jgi:acyl-coenzyme A synthetase/AMP-(fatty) acid ligase
VAADIVTQADVDTGALREELKTYLAARLARHMVPAFIRFVPDFEMNAAGKLKRI